MFYEIDETALIHEVLITQGAMPEARRNQVHDKRIPVLQPGADLQRRGCRGYSEGERERDKDRVDELEQELGSELAVKRRSGGPIPVV